MEDVSMVSFVYTISPMGQALCHSLEISSCTQQRWLLLFCSFQGVYFVNWPPLWHQLALFSIFLIFHPRVFFFFTYYMFLCKMPQIPNTELVINNKRMFLLSHVPALFCLELDQLFEDKVSVSLIRTQYLFLYLS